MKVPFPIRLLSCFGKMPPLSQAWVARDALFCGTYLGVELFLGVTEFGHQVLDDVLFLRLNAATYGGEAVLLEQNHNNNRQTRCRLAFKTAA